MAKNTKKSIFMQKYVLAPLKTVFRYLFLFFATLLALSVIVFLSLGF